MWPPGKRKLLHTPVIYCYIPQLCLIVMKLVCVYIMYLAAGLLCKAVVVVQGLRQTRLQQLLQSGPGQSVTPNSVHLQTQLEQQ